MILVVDPGDTTGFASFYENGEQFSRWQDDFDGVLKFLSSKAPIATDLSHIIVEDYRLRGGKQAQQTGSRFQAVQVIGALKYHALLHNVQFELVTTQAKTLGAMYSGINPPSNHKLSHEIDAYNIGIYWLVWKGIIDVPALRDLKDLENL